jgi:hypothetical protein
MAHVKGGSVAPAVHVLHAHDNVASLVQEGSEEGHDVGGIAFVHDLQLAHDLSTDLGLGVDADDLRGSARFQTTADGTDLAGHDGLGGSVLDLADSAAVASAQFAQDDEVLGPEVEAELDADFQRIANVVLSDGGGRSGTGGTVEGQVANVLALHGLGLERRWFVHVGGYRGAAAEYVEGSPTARGRREEAERNGKRETGIGGTEKSALELEDVMRREIEGGERASGELSWRVEFDDNWVEACEWRGSHGPWLRYFSACH